MDYKEVLKTLACFSVAHGINSIVLNPAYRCHSLAPACFLVVFTLFFIFVHALSAILTTFTWLFPIPSPKLSWKVFPSAKSPGQSRTVTLCSDLGSISTWLPVNPEISVILIIFTFLFSLLHCEQVAPSWGILHVAWLSGVKKSSFPPVCLPHQLSRDWSWLSRYPSPLLVNKVKAPNGCHMAQWLSVGVSQPRDSPCSATHPAPWSYGT